MLVISFSDSLQCTIDDALTHAHPHPAKENSKRQPSKASHPFLVLVGIPVDVLQLDFVSCTKIVLPGHSANTQKSWSESHKLKTGAASRWRKSIGSYRSSHLARRLASCATTSCVLLGASGPPAPTRSCRWRSS
jgi:hypothetical protein